MRNWLSSGARIHSSLTSSSMCDGLLDWGPGMKVWAPFLKRPENQWDGFAQTSS
jgi:hypothetical protein